MSPADLADLRRPNHKTTLTSQPHQTVFLCDIMQLAAFSSASSALSAREYSRKSTQSIGKEETHVSLADHADYRRQN